MVSALVTWGLILDRSLAEIAATSANPETFDGHLVNRIADVWDNNTVPFFGAALARTKRRREHLAEAGLLWMADFGPDRRAWALTHTTALGYQLNLPELTPNHPYAAEPAETGPIHGVARVAVRLLHWAMIETRVVGFLALEGNTDKAETPVHALSLAFAGTGTAVIKAGSSRFNRDAAFLTLITSWLNSSPEAREWFRHQLQELATFDHEDPAVQTAAADILRAAADG
ncbi:hypothetical protein GCM10009554_34860 [Kribbella koreensis]|uniref:HEAT repeat domain-containing protein n=1 Tax=Kribbella koreensis TaxID=57909 RepID=A0ABP4B0V1_9ACTN